MSQGGFGRKTVRREELHCLGAESRAVVLRVAPPVRHRIAAHPLHLLKLHHGVTLLHDGSHEIEDVARLVACKARPPLPLDGEGTRPLRAGAGPAAGTNVLSARRLVEQSLAEVREGRLLLCHGKPVSHFSPVNQCVDRQDNLYGTPFPVLGGFPTLVLMYKIYALTNCC